MNWILTVGYAKVIAGAFTVVLFLNCVAVVVFMVFGKKIRVFTAGTWLARIHKASAVKGESH